jgi:hypothetical protein
MSSFKIVAKYARKIKISFLGVANHKNFVKQVCFMKFQPEKLFLPTVTHSEKSKQLIDAVNYSGSLILTTCCRDNSNAAYKPSTFLDKLLGEVFLTDRHRIE